MRIAFIANRCVLDPRSGGAINMKTVLEKLAAAGHECHSITMTRFDGDEAFPLERLIGPEHASERYRHCFLEAWHRDVGHRLFSTASTRLPDLTRAEAEKFVRGTGGLLKAIQPDLVLTMGGDPLSEALHRLAWQSGAVVVFMLANAGYKSTERLGWIHEFWALTPTLADHYRQTLGLDPRVVRTVFTREQFLDHPHETGPAAHGNRGYVTLINPSPEKGATLFFRLAELAERQRPDLQFMAVEARVSAAEWRALGIDPAVRRNITWVRNRRDMRPAYRRTTLLLMPSLWFEAAGRVPVEGQLSGIPVLASNRGGLPDQLNGGGFLFDPPEACIKDYFHMPTAAEVQPWLDRITGLLDDPDAWARASADARSAAAPFHPDERMPALARAAEAAHRAHAGQ